MDAEEKIARLRLLRTRKIGPATYGHLMECHGTALKVLEAFQTDPKLRQMNLRPPSRQAIADEVRQFESDGGHYLFTDQFEYPDLLNEIPLAPPVLSFLGQPVLLKKSKVAIVGARNASHAGLRMAEKLAAELSEAGQVIVSGMARGVDSAAHHAALNNGTIAVLAGGIDIVYPPENQQLYQEITQSGIVMSEMPLGQEPLARLFPRRNRIIAGLVKLVIVVEASLKSGSCITAGFAADLGREVGAVPGSPLDTRNLGALKLIKDGCHLISSSQDALHMIEELEQRAPFHEQPAGSSPRKDQRPVLPDKLEEAKAMILEYLGIDPCPYSDLTLDIPLPEKTLIAALALLELEGRIAREWDNTIRQVLP